MRIGIDFDNTIVCYDAVIHRHALRRGLIPGTLPARKEEVRNYLRRLGREEDWTRLQGYVYGPGLEEAPPFPGVLRFFELCRRHGTHAWIVSHKTPFPYLGPRYDLLRCAREWLRRHGFHDPDGIGMDPGKVFFEKTKEEKLARIRSLGCDHFIDDLPEFLGEPAFPERVARILFDPSAAESPTPGVRRAASWEEIAGIILSPRSAPA